MTAVCACVFYIFSPMALRFNIRVATDPLFTLLFLLSVLHLLRFHLTHQQKNIFLSLFFAGLSTLTRYQGFALLPLLVIVIVKALQEKKISLRTYSFLGAIPYLLIPWWWIYRGFGHTAQYKDRMGESIFSTLANYSNMAEGFILILPYALTYPIFCLFCYGVYRMMKENEHKTPLKTFVYLFILWLITHSAFLSFQTRYFLPLLPFFLIIASYGISTLQAKGRRIAISVCLFISIIFSTGVLYFQRDAFGDVKRASIWIRDNTDKKTVFSDEFYKTSFWAEAEVKSYRSDEIEPGDYIVLHSFYSYLPNSLNYLKSKYVIALKYETISEIVPLLPDLMNPSNLTNTPLWMNLKYRRQQFKSLVCEVIEELNYENH